MCVSGIPVQKKEHAINICKLALDMNQFVQGINIQHEVLDKPIWNLRIGIHSGPIIASIKTNSLDIWGDSVNIASRIENSGYAGKIHISEQTANYLGDGFILEARGNIYLKNKGSWNTFFLNKSK